MRFNAMQAALCSDSISLIQKTVGKVPTSAVRLELKYGP
jgi:hypothetical protein